MGAAIDSFHVPDFAGKKITDTNQLDQIHERLQAAIQLLAS
jgi:hypothetical protein